MVLALPPRRTIKYDEATRKLVHDRLTAIIAGHPQALTTYQFYEDIDQWLGPWGDKGYPIGYGKFYNLAFSNNARLMANPDSSRWVRKTTVLLQEAIRDYIDERMKASTLRTITEEEFREAAFASHPKAYTDAGLALVALNAPELIPVISLIPKREFNPSSDNFGSTVGQVFRTASILTLFNGMDVLGVWVAHDTPTMAMRRDEQNVYHERQVGIALEVLRRDIVAGRLDDLRILRSVEVALNGISYQNRSLEYLARAAYDAAVVRRQALSKSYGKLIALSPEIEKAFRERYGQLLRE